MVVGLCQFHSRRADGAGEPVLDAENGEELMHVQVNVSVALGNYPPESPGTLYITTRRVLWLSDVDRDKGYSVDFLSISLHAVSRDPEAYSSPCIYTQIDVEDDGDESEGSDSEPNDMADLSRVKEMRLIPSSPEQLDTLFQVFCECAELNPDLVDENDPESHEWIFSADQLAGGGSDEEDSEWTMPQNQTSSIGRSNGEHDLARNVLQLHINDQRFEDAEEMEEANGKH